MPITIEWPEIALRLALTVAAGTLIGLHRSEHGHSAGLRTTLLVCLAASVSMIQVNLLPPIGGKSPARKCVGALVPKRRVPLHFSRALSTSRECSNWNGSRNVQ
jgi:MgtC family